MELSKQHELHALIVGGATYGITRNLKTTAMVTISLMVYMGAFGHGLPQIGRNEKEAPTQSQLIMQQKVLQKAIHHDAIKATRRAGRSMRFF